jgi:hypothetical protein
MSDCLFMYIKTNLDASLSVVVVVNSLNYCPLSWQRFPADELQISSPHKTNSIDHEKHMRMSP